MSMVPSSRRFPRVTLEPLVSCLGTKFSFVWFKFKLAPGWEKVKHYHEVVGSVVQWLLDITGIKMRVEKKKKTSAWWQLAHFVDSVDVIDRFLQRWGDHSKFGNKSVIVSMYLPETHSPAVCITYQLGIRILREGINGTLFSRFLRLAYTLLFDHTPCVIRGSKNNPFG